MDINSNDLPWTTNRNAFHWKLQTCCKLQLLHCVHSRWSNFLAILTQYASSQSCYLTFFVLSGVQHLDGCSCKEESLFED